MTVAAPALPALPVTTSPVRALRVLANDVEPSADPHGEGLAGAAPQTLVELVRGRRVTHVVLGAHGAGDGGAVDAWTGRACRVLRGRRTSVSALGGEAGWLGARGAGHPAFAWVRAALALGPFHRVHVALTPWELPDWADGHGPVWHAYLAALDAVRLGARGLPVDVDVPWWFASTPADDGATHLEHVLARASRVTVLAGSPDAEKVLDGMPDAEEMLARVEPVARACEARGREMWVGVDAAAFASAGAVEGTGAAVRRGMQAARAYRGVEVLDHAAWLEMLERGGELVGA